MGRHLSDHSSIIDPHDDRAYAQWRADDLARINARLSPLRDKLDGVLLFRVSEHNGVLVIKDKSQVQLYLIDRWRVQDYAAFLSQLGSERNLQISGIMSRIDLLQPLNLLGVYTQAMMLTLAWFPNPRQVYMLGFGGGRIPMVLRHYFPDVAVDSSELDGEVVSVAHEYFAIDLDDKMNVTIGDGRNHLAAMPPDTAYDILMIDCYSGSGKHPDELATQDFYALCKSRLQAGGVAATNLIESDPKYGAKAERFASSFAHVYDFNHEGAHVLIGTDGEELSLEQLVERARAIEAKNAFQFPLGERATKVSRLYKSDLSTIKSRHPVPPPAASVPRTPADEATPNSPPPLRGTPGNVPRNAPCPCGSGKKYKKCCLPTSRTQFT
jgi:spermidine synthase